MTHTFGDKPLGKSVEEVESESGNLVNSPVEGEVRRAEDVAAVIPAIGVANGNASSVPAVINPAGLVEGGGGAYDGTANTNRDTTSEV